MGVKLVKMTPWGLVPGHLVQNWWITIAQKSAIFNLRFRHEIDTKNEKRLILKNEKRLILKTFLVFSTKVVLLVSFCHSMMVKLGSEFLYQEHFYKINIWPLGRDVRQSSVKVAAAILNRHCAYWQSIFQWNLHICTNCLSQRASQILGLDCQGVTLQNIRLC